MRRHDCCGRVLCRGRVVESVNADGLRSGTIYYPNGQVHYSGTLAGSAPGGWYETSNPLQQFQNYTTTEYDRFNINRIDVGGVVESGDGFTITFTDITGTQSASVSVSGHSNAGAVVADLAQAINDSTNPLFAQVDATVSQEGYIRLTPAPGVSDPRYLYTLSVTNNSGDSPTFWARTSLRSTRVVDAKGHVTLSVQDSAGASRTLFDDGSFTQSLGGINGEPVAGHVVSGQVVTGRQETRIDQAGVATDYFYDAAGRLTDVYLPQVPDPENGNALTRPHWRYEYDVNGNQMAQVDPQGRRTEFSYDQQNRRISRTLPAVDGVTGSEIWSYDSFGRVMSHSDFKGQTT